MSFQLLGSSAGLHQVAVDHQAVADHLGRDADVVGLVGRHDVLDVGDRAVRLEVAVARHQPGGRAAVVMEVAQEAAGRLLDAHALAHLAGARLEQLDLDAVLVLERLDDRLVEGRADRGGVDDELAFLLGGLDDLRPVVGLRRGGPSERGAAASMPQDLLLNMVPSSRLCFQSVLMRFLMKRSCTQRNTRTRTSMTRPMTLTSSGLPLTHIFSITTDSTSVPGA